MEQEIKIKTGLRMYLLVPYNIMPIQKGIQGGHAAEQYAYEMIKDIIRDLAVGKKAVMADKISTWLDYIKNHKTWIILNGGTTNYSSGEKRGSLNLLRDQLVEGKCTHSIFHEPDLNDALSAICFLVDEKVWDFETYPMYKEWSSDLWELYENYDDGTGEPDTSEKTYKKFVGGKQNIIFKEIIYKRPLAV